MKAKHHYIFFVTLLIFGIGVLFIYTFREQKWLLLFSEVYVIFLILYAFQVYQKIFQPINLLQQGLNALKDEDFNVKFTPTSSKDINQLVLVYNAMIDKLRNEKVYQQEQHYFLNLLIEAMPVGLIILDFDQKVSEFNSQSKQMFGLASSNIGQPLKNIAHEIGDELQTLLIGESKVIKIGSVNYYRCTANRFMYKGFPRIFILIEELSNELLENEKKAYGKVIRMMAHEVNNSIGAINSILNSIISHQPIDENEVNEYLPILIERNEGLAQFMKNFAKVIRLPKPVKNKVNINDLLVHILQLMRSRDDAKHIDFSTNFNQEAWIISADKNQLEQAFINIIKNSIEAIGEGKGQIQIHTNEDRQEILITDNGIGIEKEKEELLFTPFFSTKPTGQGVGLTLVKEILYNHGWQFTLSTIGDQTTFKVILK